MHQLRSFDCTSKTSHAAIFQTLYFSGLPGATGEVGLAWASYRTGGQPDRGDYALDRRLDADLFAGDTQYYSTTENFAAVLVDRIAPDVGAVRIFLRHAALDDLRVAG